MGEVWPIAHISEFCLRSLPAQRHSVLTSTITIDQLMLGT